jgi:hypothetical protein
MVRRLVLSAGRRGKGCGVPFRDAPAVVPLQYNYLARSWRESYLVPMSFGADRDHHGRWTGNASRDRVGG